jgi:oxygen-independent coproporphyrinogen III oxidase
MERFATRRGRARDCAARRFREPLMTPAASTTAQLLQRYDRPGPRYTSYPTAVEFSDAFTEADYRERLATADTIAEPLSFYAHLPFCEERCLYCGCNVVITRHRDVAAQYLDHLLLEVDLLARHLPNRRTISQMHWGGGTPTYYSSDDLERFHRAIAGRFAFSPDAEIGIEVDPRVTTLEQLSRLRRLGFNRLSMGVQDFAPEVQQAVNRIQSYELTKDLVDHARAEGYASINIDLIFGLPFQTVEAFRHTLDQVATIRPDRIAVYSFAFVPWIKAHMKHLPTESLPDPALKLELLSSAIDVFGAAGYRQIGMDHFALPEDELSRAAQGHTLHRNFMGYTVQSARDMVAVGISGIGDVQGAYVQNGKKLPDYYEALVADRFPVERGFRLDADDLIRRAVITQIMCNSHLDFADVERRFGIDFHAYFARELAELSGPESPVEDGLLEIGADALQLTTRGRPFVRNVCMSFDRHLREKQSDAKPVFSRTV